MAESRFMRAAICGWSPDGWAIVLRFQHDNETETDVWVDTRDIPELMLRLHGADEGASRATAGNSDAIRTIRTQRLTELTVGESVEGTSFLRIAFESGLDVHMGLSDEAVDTLTDVVSHLQQTKVGKIEH